MVIVFLILSSSLKNRKYPIVGIINSLKKIIESWKDRVLSIAKKEININVNQNTIETKKKLSFKKLTSCFKIIKLNKKNKAQKVIDMSGNAGPVINKTGTSIKTIRKKLLEIFIDP